MITAYVSWWMGIVATVNLFILNVYVTLGPLPSWPISLSLVLVSGKELDKLLPPYLLSNCYIANTVLCTRDQKNSLFFQEFYITFSWLPCEQPKLSGISLSLVLEQKPIKANKQINPNKTKQQQQKVEILLKWNEVRVTEMSKTGKAGRHGKVCWEYNGT